MEESARRLLSVSDLESVASSLSGRSEVPYVLQIPAAPLPQPHENEIPVSVCHVESPTHFWCHRLEQSFRRDYTHMSKIIGDYGRNCPRWDVSVPVRKGNLVMGPFAVDGSPPTYYRAKVLSTQLGVASHRDRRVRLYFIDFGNAAEVAVGDLRVVPDALLQFAPLAIECHLTGVGPSVINDPKGEWTAKAKEWFEAHTIDKELTAKVFSVVDGVTTLDLVEKDGDWGNSMANRLLEQKFAVKVDESYCSKLDNEVRQTASESQYKPTGLLAMQRKKMSVPMGISYFSKEISKF